MQLNELKAKINSITNTGKVTKALELIAATKQRKNQINLKNSRYARNALKENLNNLYDDIIRSIAYEELPYFFKNNEESNKVLIICVMSKRGLCGSLNSKLFYSIIKLKDKLQEQKLSVEFISINRMAQVYLSSFKENIKAYFNNISENPSYDEVLPLISFIIDKYEDKTYKQIYIAYSEFIKTGIFKPTINQILPIQINQEKELNTNNQINQTTEKLNSILLIEPNPLEVLTKISKLYLEFEIFEAILSSIASENTARMISMKKATDNISSLKNKLILRMNKLRQAKITRQVSEVIAGIK